MKFDTPLLFHLLIFKRGSLGVLIRKEIGCVTLPEHHWSQGRPDLGVSPVLTEDVSRIQFPRDVLKVDDSSCDGLSHIVVGQGMVSLF